MTTLSGFVERLAAGSVGPSSVNFYAGGKPDAALRRDNLHLYLRSMAARRPRALLVGEAPGYRGCRQTGVPFTSPAVLAASPYPFGLFDKRAGFHVAGHDGRPLREATATIVWEALSRLDALPLLWNAFPYHPHRPGDVESNRPPTADELAAGQWAIVALIALFGIERVVAVGNKAAKALAMLSIPATRVRHPAHGGKAAFVSGLAAALAVAGGGSNPRQDYGSNDAK